MDYVIRWWVEDVCYFVIRIIIFGNVEFGGNYVFNWKWIKGMKIKEVILVF